MNFDPINSEHAVQTASFTIVFDGMVSPPAVAELQKRNDLIGELPAVQSPQGFEFNLGPAGAPIQRRLPGVQLSHLRPDGTPAWALRMIGNELSVECNRYTRWNRVWSTAGKYLDAGLGIVAERDNKRKVNAMAQSFVDVFVSNGDNYQLSELLNQSDLISSKVFESGRIWHSHVGWFAQKPGETPTWLHQVNIDALPHPPSNNPKVQITHNQILAFNPPIETTEARSLINDKMLAMHVQNKDVLKRLLSKQAAARITLDAK